MNYKPSAVGLNKKKKKKKKLQGKPLLFNNDQ